MPNSSMAGPEKRPFRSIFYEAERTTRFNRRAGLPAGRLFRGKTLVGEFLREARGEALQPAHHMRQIRLQAAEGRPAREGDFIHVERAVDFDLQAVLIPGRLPVTGDNLRPFVELVNRDAVSHRPQTRRGDG